MNLFHPLSLQTDLSFLPLLIPSQISISLLNPLVFIIFILTFSIALRYLHIVQFGQEKTHNLGLDPFPSAAAPLNLSHDGTKPGGCGWGWDLAQPALDRSNEQQETHEGQEMPSKWYLLRGKWGKLISVITEDSKTGTVWPSTETGFTIPSDYWCTCVKIAGFQGEKKEFWCTWGIKRSYQILSTAIFFFLGLLQMLAQPHLQREREREAKL